jgi:hypothetical protein
VVGIEERWGVGEAHCEGERRQWRRRLRSDSSELWHSGVDEKQGEERRSVARGFLVEEKMEGEKNSGSVAVDVSQRAVTWSSGGGGVLAAATHGGEGGGGLVAGKMRGRRKRVVAGTVWEQGTT